MSSWLNPKFRRIPATSPAYASLQARGLHLVEPLGFSLEEKALRRAGMDYWDKCDVRTWPSFEALRQDSGDARFLFLTTKTKRLYWDGSSSSMAIISFSDARPRACQRVSSPRMQSIA